MWNDSCELTTICRETPEGVAITIVGHLTATNVPAVEAFLDSEFDGFAGDVILEMDGVESISARAVMFLVTAQRRLASRGRRLVLASASAAVRRTLAVSQICDVPSRSRVVALEPS